MSKSWDLKILCFLPMLSVIGCSGKSEKVELQEVKYCTSEYILSSLDHGIGSTNLSYQSFEKSFFNDFQIDDRCNVTFRNSDRSCNIEHVIRNFSSREVDHHMFMDVPFDFDCPLAFFGAENVAAASEKFGEKYAYSTNYVRILFSDQKEVCKKYSDIAMIDTQKFAPDVLDDVYYLTGELALSCGNEQDAIKWFDKSARMSNYKALVQISAMNIEMNKKKRHVF